MHLMIFSSYFRKIHLTHLAVSISKEIIEAFFRIFNFCQRNDKMQKTLTNRYTFECFTIVWTSKKNPHNHQNQLNILSWNNFSNLFSTIGFGDIVPGDSVSTHHEDQYSGAGTVASAAAGLAEVNVQASFKIEI